MLSTVVLSLGLSLVAAWLALAIVLLVARPGERQLRETVRLLPDLLRLVRRLAADDTLPSGVRRRLWLLVVYLASPIDLIPDFVPVLGYADDAIIIGVVLRSTARRAGLHALRRHWPGTDEGFDALCRICGLGPGPQAPT